MGMMQGRIFTVVAVSALLALMVRSALADAPAAPSPSVPAAPAATATPTPSVPSPPAPAGPAAPAAAAPTTATPPAPESQDLSKTEIRRGVAAPATSGAPASPASPAPSMDLGRVTLALTAVIALILFLRWGSRKILAIPAAGTSPHVMRVVARSPIAPKQNVLLLRVGQRLVIVGDSGGRLSALGQITDADEIATIVGQAKSNATSPPANFGGMLRRLSRRFRGMEPGEIAEDEAGDIEETDSRQERQSLLGGLDAREADAAAQKSAIDASETKVGFDDAAAEAAVEAARRDVAALREKLREVSQRMAVGSGTAEAAKDSPAPPATGTA